MFVIRPYSAIFLHIPPSEHVAITVSHDEILLWAMSGVPGSPVWATYSWSSNNVTYIFCPVEISLMMFCQHLDMDHVGWTWTALESRSSFCRRLIPPMFLPGYMFVIPSYFTCSIIFLHIPPSEHVTTTVGHDGFWLRAVSWVPGSPVWATYSWSSDNVTYIFPLLKFPLQIDDVLSTSCYGSCRINLDSSWI